MGTLWAKYRDVIGDLWGTYWGNSCILALVPALIGGVGTLPSEGSAYNRPVYSL